MTRSDADDAVFVAGLMRSRVAQLQFAREQREHERERSDLLDRWFWHDPAAAETAKRAANLTVLLGRRAEALFGLAAGQQLTLCEHLAEVTADGLVLSDETPARLCGLPHQSPQPVRCPACADWHLGGHRVLPECDGCGRAPGDQWRNLDLRLVGVWAATNGLTFGDCLVRLEPAAALCVLCSALFEEESFRPLMVQGPT